MENVENVSNGDNFGTAMQVGQVNGDIVINVAAWNPPAGPAVIRVIERVKPPRFQLVGNTDTYKLKFSVERTGQPIRVHEVAVLFISPEIRLPKVRLQIDGFDKYERTFSLVHSRREEQVHDYQIEGVPIRFDLRSTALNNTKIASIYLGELLAWRIRHA